MEKSCRRVRVHPDLLDLLFAHKGQCLRIFNDIKGIHEIDHLAVTWVTKKNQLLSLSSSPAIEYKLFSGQLWEYDLTYNPSWIQRQTHQSWESLYNPLRFDELYYLKQIKTGYQTGASFSAYHNEHFVIYSFASKKACPHTLELFTDNAVEFTKIGQYCLNTLLPLFLNVELAETNPEKVTA